MSVPIILATAVGYFTNVLEFLIFVRIILSWFPMQRSNMIVIFLYNVTEPILAPIRNLLIKSPLGRVPIDFSPIIAYWLIGLFGNIITWVIFSVASRFFM